MGLLGVQYPEQKGKWILLTKRFRLIVLSVFVFLLVAFGVFTFYFSSQAEFCESCHFIKPYVDSWRVSSHKDVSCNQCHFPPGIKGTLHAKASGLIELMKTITGDFGTIPQAEIEDSACLREGCHVTRLLTGEVRYMDKYRFNHTPHLTELRRGKRLRCTSCHSQMVQGTHMTVTEGVCFTCHFKGKVHDRVLDPIAGCTSCHQSPTEPIETTTGIVFDHKPFLDREVACWKCHFDAVQGTGDVPRQLCQSCHGDREKLAKYADSELIHNHHVTDRKVECFQCHSEIRHGLHPQAEAKENRCATCHSAGHNDHGDMFAGRGGLGVEGEPSRHSLVNVDCVACHQVPALEGDKLGEDAPSHRATEQSCVECHGSGRKGMLAEWKGSLTETLAEVAEGIVAAQAAYAARSDQDPRKAKMKPLLDAARHNYEFVRRASGVHNLDYAMDLLDKAAEDAENAAQIAEE